MNHKLMSKIRFHIHKTMKLGTYSQIRRFFKKISELIYENISITSENY